MSLRAQAEADLNFILEDLAGGFGWSVTITDPAGNSATLTGQAVDISQLIDADTGTPVGGRQASVALRISSLTAAGLALPEHISNNAGRPWLVDVTDVNGNAYNFMVSESRPDRMLGLVVCMLETWAP